MKSMIICRWVFVLFLAALVSGCMFNPPSPEISSKNIEVSLHEYLALLKASGRFEIGAEELERQITQLLNNQKFSGRSILPGKKTVITGLRKISISEKNKTNRSIVTNENEGSSVNVYIFNTENAEGTEGYVLASNDMRLGIVLAMVDGSSLENQPEWWNDIIFEGLGNYIDYITDLYNNIGDEEVQQTLRNPVPMSDNRSIYVYSGSGSNNSINGKGLIHHWYPNAADVKSATWSWTEGYEARTDSGGLRVLTNWHQNYPYNYYVCGGNEASASANDYCTGCGIVAMAQLMAIWGQPKESKISTFTYNWTQMRNDFTNTSFFWLSKRSVSDV